VEILVGQIEGSSVTPEELFFEPEIVARGSTATARSHGLRKFDAMQQKISG
jgi:hypothetical protein